MINQKNEKKKNTCPDNIWSVNSRTQIIIKIKYIKKHPLK